MSFTKQCDLYDDLALFTGTVFMNLVLASLHRKLTDDETALLHRAADLKVMVDDLAGV